ncbi:MAG: LPS assembly lipoprotein LptE [Cellvibrionaceae bacterium]
MARTRLVKTTPALLLSLVLISACGWHLRGTLALPEGLDTVYLNDQAGAEVLSRTMEELLTANQVKVATGHSNAQLVINILDYREDRRVVSIGGNTLVTEYELIARAIYSLEDGQGNVLLPSAEASVIRSYEFDENNVLGKAEEERLIQQEMRRELAQQIIRRLRFMDLDSAQALANHHKLAKH